VDVTSGSKSAVAPTIGRSSSTDPQADRSTRNCNKLLREFLSLFRKARYRFKGANGFVECHWRDHRRLARCLEVDKAVIRFRLSTTTTRRACLSTASRSMHRCLRSYFGNSSAIRRVFGAMTSTWPRS